ncbi:MAG: aspartate aminotransferase family protein [Leucobacter sp.]|nr:aspartate aminotransferase family protein [Leucobacter sp.]
MFAYVYDSGLPELDALAGRAAELARPLNGLDPLAFPSIAAMERDLVAFVRRAVNGHVRRAGGPVVGTVTSGGTESCLLAVKTARELWRRDHPEHPGRPRLVAPVTAHAAFQKAARLLDLEWDPVACGPDGSVRAADLVSRLDRDVALVVVSAPAYPSGTIDPIATVSDAALARGISCHVDACFGGLALPWWPETPVWDFRNPGVTSLSADLHKYGYAPKGVSVLLHRGRARRRAQFFATTRWPGYPVVNPTLLGSRSAAPVAAAWAITQRLGPEGFQQLTAACVRATRQIAHAVGGIRGLAVLGAPLGPALALIADPSVPVGERVDPHRLADAVGRLGFKIQHQPGFTQANGIRLPRSAHLSITPVTEHLARDFAVALANAADAVRGQGRPAVGAPLAALRALGYGERGRVPGPTAAWAILRSLGIRKNTLPGDQAGLMALVEELPAPVAEALLVELLGRTGEP